MLRINRLIVRNYLHIDSLTIAPGQLVAVCGPNGSGKSTLLEALSGYLPPYSGSIQLDGKELTDYSVAELASVRSWLAQQQPHRASISIAQQLAWVIEPYRHLAPAQQVVDEVIHDLSLSSILHRPLLQLSGGELQRAYLASLLVASDRRLNPAHQLVLLDEPLTALDPRYQHQVIEKLLALQAQGQTILISLHDLNIAMFYAMDVLLLSQGRLTICGAARDVLTQERISELFGVSMTQIRINGRNQLVLS
ncbi:ABC transporter ATP-binding protein [Celerinatantimonas sp. YJH-8]|uniref:ABC transporter ATP-binding protein n=1 Tax=Celerinatantimonas sp. YJH-8 TaxID=3228714 RepID=UPI0038C79C02